MKSIKSTFLLLFCLLATLTSNATFSILGFDIDKKNSEGNLNHGGLEKTSFRASYTLSKNPDGQFNSIVVDVIYVSNDQSKIISLGPAKTYYDASTPSGSFSDYIDAVLGPELSTGRIYLRIRSATTQPMEIRSNNSFGISTTTNPDGATEEQLAARKTIRPEGDKLIWLTPAGGYSTPDLVTFYLVGYSTKKDGVIDQYLFSAIDPLPGGIQIRKEFYAFLRPAPNTIPVYQFTKKSNRSIVMYSAIMQQDDSIWELDGRVFYAYPGHVRFETNTIPELNYTINLSLNRSTDAPERLFYATVAPETTNKQWNYEYIDGKQVYSRPSVYATGFSVFPAYRMTAYPRPPR